ncbi:PAS domain-containing sensor histidine kinase [Pseudomonas sp. WN033]|nr:PAS domain-containing sensor histidine kinase [Pseudomonas sp. WN033]
MKLWRMGGKPVEQPQPETAAGALAPGEEALYLRLDAQARVLELSPALQRQLPVLPELSLLSAYLAQPVVWLREVPARWPTQVPALLFKGLAGCRLSMPGWLCQEGEHWLLCLFDTSEQHQRLEDAERRQQLFSQTWQYAERLADSRDPEVARLLAEWLDELLVRLQVPWLAVALPQGGRWQVYQHARMPGIAGPPWNERELQKLLGDSVTEAGLWRVPYREQGQVVAWLLADGSGPARRLSFMRDEHWSQLFALLAAPLLHGVRAHERAVQGERSAVLQQMLGSGWWEVSAQQRVSLAPHLLAQLGLTPEEDGALSLETWLAGVDPADRSEFRLRLDDALVHGRGFCQSLRLGAAGQSRWYRIQVEALGAGRGRHLFGFVLDINDSRQKENEAALARARLEGLVDSAPAIIYVQGYQDGALFMEFCSASLEAVLGWRFEDLQDASLATFLHPDDREVFFARTRTLLRDGVARCRYRIRDRNNRYHWMIDEARLLRDERGLPHEVVGLCLDVTEATEAAEQVRESEERYRVLVEDSPAMICRYRPDLTLTFANLPLIKSLGVETEAGQKLNLGQYLSDEQRQNMHERLAQLTPEQPVSSTELCMHLPGRAHAWWVWSDRGLFDAQGRLVEIQAVGRDNTEVHQARQQLYQSAKMATLGEMATGLAHEINQPLNVMRMALANMFKRLESDSLTPDYLREKLERVEAQVTRAAKIVDHVRIFGRRSDVEGTLFDPAKAVEGALSLVLEGLDKHSVELQVEVPVLPSVAGHGDRLEQVLINLLLNAQYVVVQRREQEPGFQPRIRVQGEVHGRGVRLCVEDNGGGIEPGMLERIFEPFVTTKPVGKGTGLGLSVSYGIITQMRGRLWACNTDEGASFVIELPAAEDVASA